MHATIESAAKTHSVENREAVDDLINAAEACLGSVTNGVLKQWLSEAIEAAKKGRIR